MFLSLSIELLRSGYSVRFRPAGHSMHPTIRDGETVTVEPVSAREVRRGDILLYKAERGLIAHRVIRFKKKGSSARAFVLRGDASASCEEVVGPEQVLGRVVSVERGGRAVDLASRKIKLWQTARLRAAHFKDTLLPARRTEAL